MNMDFHSKISDNSAQNAATTLENMKDFIHWIYDNNLFMKYDIIHDTIYGCGKQYRCENLMWLLFVL